MSATNSKFYALAVTSLHIYCAAKHIFWEHAVQTIPSDTQYDNSATNQADMPSYYSMFETL
eukprot:scaffold657361_cov65-Prasinocladus_malaysianus.AAC.1